MKKKRQIPFKRKMAMKMQTREERNTRGGLGAPFNSKAWHKRSENRHKKELARMNNDLG
jgi:hypothetical protein